MKVYRGLSSGRHVCNVVHAYSKVTHVQIEHHALTLNSLASASFNLSPTRESLQLYEAYSNPPS